MKKIIKEVIEDFLASNVKQVVISSEDNTIEIRKDNGLVFMKAVKLRPLQRGRITIQTKRNIFKGDIRIKKHSEGFLFNDLAFFKVKDILVGFKPDFILFGK